MASKPSIFLEIRVFLKTAMAQRVKKHVPSPSDIRSKTPKTELGTRHFFFVITHKGTDNTFSW